MSTLVSLAAPDFTAPAVLADGKIIDDFNLHQSLKGRYGLLFFYPLDFTFVCPSELIALDHAVANFEERNVQVIGVSIDSHFTHNAWRNTPVDEGGIGPVRFPLVADITHNIARSYGVEHPEVGVAFRGAFIIDKAGLVRAEMIYDLPLGRSTAELLRTVDALQHFEQHGEVCPANWAKGKQGMKASPEGVATYLKENAKAL